MRLTLRARVAAAFAALALLLSAMSALMTYELSRRYLLAKRESGATRVALIDAAVASTALHRRRVQVPALPAINNGDVSYGALMRVAGKWYGEGAATAGDRVPASLLAIASTGAVARQRAEYRGTTALFVAVPIPGSDALYVEVFPLADLQRTLSTLALVTIIGAAITTLLGALVGLLASRRVMRPLRDVASAADDIAHGALDRRLESTQDADLALLVDSFNHMVGVLEDRFERDARFASDVSHELRTPLTAIRGALDLLGRRVGDDGREMYELLRRECVRFDQLVLDLLEVSRFDSSPQELTPEPVDPRRVVESALRATGHDTVPVAVSATTPGVFNLDRRRVERVLSNLLTNADLHAGGPLRVAISGIDHRLCIAVEDAGPGVPADERSLIFERFHRGRHGGLSGTGLGLAIASEHCQAHGGQVRLEDRPGGGSVFVIEIQELPEVPL